MPLDAEFSYGGELPDEDAQLELKSGFDHADIGRTVCGMLNCAGGVLLIGVGDDGVVRGLYAAAPDVLVTRATRTIERDVWPRPAGLLRVEAPPLSSGWGGQRRYLVRVVVRDLRTCGGGRCYYAISDAAGNHAAGWSFGGKWWVPYVRQQASTCALEPQGRARREGPGSQRLQRLQGLAGQGLAGQGLAGQGRALVVEVCEGSMLLERVKDLCC